MSKVNAPVTPGTVSSLVTIGPPELHEQTKHTAAATESLRRFMGCPLGVRRESRERAIHAGSAQLVNGTGVRGTDVAWTPVAIRADEGYKPGMPGKSFFSLSRQIIGRALRLRC